VTTDCPAVGPHTAAEVFFRLYERHEIALIRHRLLPNCDILEIGAGIGVTGAHALCHTSTDTRLISVEANAALLPTLRTNLDRHRAGRDVTVVHGALSYAGAPRVTLQQSAEHMASQVGAQSDDACAVPVYTLTDLVDEYNLRDYALLLDVEGTEHDLIKHDRTALSSCQQLIIELHGSATHVEGMLSDLSATGFRLTQRRKNICALRREKQAPLRLGVTHR
jgi:FkbM family methyltransferase